MKILLINLGGIGDIIMLSPALKALRDKSPGLEIDLLCLQRSAEIASAYGEINRLFILPLQAGAGFLKSIAVLKNIRKEKFNYAVNFKPPTSKKGNLKAKVLMKLIGSEITIGRKTGELGNFYDHCAAEDFVAEKSEVKYMLGLLEPLGIGNISDRIFYPIDEKDEKKIDKFLKGNEMENKFKIALNPGAFRESRRWPLKHWEKLIELINQKYSESEIFINGSKKELKLAEKLKAADNIYITNGKFSLNELAALLSKMDVTVNNDSGLMHLSAAVGSKIVVVFSPADDITRYSPSVEPEKVRIATNQNINLPCPLPCYENKCSEPICLASIKPDYVFSLIEELLKK